MDPILSLLLLYVVGLALFVAEIFLPSHGLLTVGALGFLGWAVYQTFLLSEMAGYVSLLVLAILLPTVAVYAIRNWHRTPIGRRISPPNPVLTREDVGARQDLLEPYIGRVGVVMTPLRPVGECRFGDDKVECVAESGMIPRGAAVKAVGIVNMSLAVRLCADGERDA
jgi:membrane-bound serine protease (ClpP class)